MEGDVKLSELDSVLSELSYPVSKDQAVSRLGGVRLRYADGGEPLADVLGRTNDDRFESPDDLEMEIYNNLPTEAVGEPGQSEGEG